MSVGLTVHAEPGNARLLQLLTKRYIGQTSGTHPLNTVHACAVDLSQNWLQRHGKPKRSREMKPRKIVLVLGLATLVGISAGALAHGNEEYRPGADNYAFRNHPAFQENLRLTREIDERQDRQMDRILGGFYERRITPQEFRRLMDGQREIQKMERGFLADGLMSRHEYWKLDLALNAASRNIFREGHDGQRSPNPGGWDAAGHR